MLASTSETASGSSTFFDDDFYEDEDEIGAVCIGEIFFLDVRSTSGFPQDSMGSVIGAADAAGALSASVKYDSFGEVVGATGTAASSSSVGGDFRLHGMWLDEVSGLYHVRARTYDASTGRFLSRDPVAGVMRRPESMTPYVLGHSNLWRYRDPSGRFGLMEASVTVAVAGILAATAYPAFQGYLTKVRAFKAGGDIASGGPAAVSGYQQLARDIGVLSQRGDKAVARYLLDFWEGAREAASLVKGDVFFFAEAEVAASMGISGSVGAVIDLDHPLQSGLFVSAGYGAGLTVGKAIGVGYIADDIEGIAAEVDANVGVVSPTFYYAVDNWTDANGVRRSNIRWNGFGLSAGPGAGIGVFATATHTFSLEWVWSVLTE